MAAILFIISCELPDKPVIHAPDAPAAPILVPDDRSLSVSWTRVTSADSYEVWVNTSNNMPTASLFGTPVKGTGTKVTGLENGIVYYIWLKAVNVSGTSVFGPSSNAVPAIPLAAPATPAAPVIIPGSQQLQVTWTADPNASAYEVWMHTENNLPAAVNMGNFTAPRLISRV